MVLNRFILCAQQVFLVKKPARQGHLDNFCGVYSLVNAVSYLYQNPINRRVLCLKLMNQYHKQHDIIQLINDGMSNIEMDELIAHVLTQGYYKQRYPIKITTPYRNKTGIRIPRLFNEIGLFLDNNSDLEPLRVVIFANQYHWTVITALDDTFLYFFDSTGIEKSLKQSFSLRRTNKPYQISLDDIYFLERAR